MENRIYMNTSTLGDSIDTLENQKLNALLASLDAIRDSVRPKLDEFAGEHAESYFKLVENGFGRAKEACAEFSKNYTSKAREDLDRTVNTMNKSARMSDDMLDNISRPTSM